MKIRFQQRYHLAAAHPDLCGNKERVVAAKKYLQYFDDEKQEWKDVPMEIDEESYQKAKRNLYK
jgi:hypothetical protein